MLKTLKGAYTIDAQVQPVINGRLPLKGETSLKGLLRVVKERGAIITNGGGWHDTRSINVSIGDSQTVYVMQEGTPAGAYSTYKDRLNKDAKDKALPLMVDGEGNPVSEGEGFINPVLTDWQIVNGALMFIP